MANWTVDQVGNWLRTNNLERYIENFKNEDIDGIALIGLNENDILKLLSTIDEDGTIKNSTMRTQRKFKAALEQYRKFVTQERKKLGRRRSIENKELDASIHDGTKNVLMKPSRNIFHTIDNVGTYSRLYTVEPMNISMKFFTSESISSYLTKYYLKKYNVRCYIPMQHQFHTQVSLSIKLSGIKENVKSVHHDLQSLFETIKTKIFNDEDKDKKIVRWSRYIYSDSILTVLQKIFVDKKKLTVWEKTSILSGFYIVHYTSGQHMFSVSEEFINQTLNNEISYVKDIVIENMESIQPKFRKELKELINEKKQHQLQNPTMSIIYCQYPSQTDMKISFFGLRNHVDLAKKQIKLLINKHRMRTIWIGLDSKQRDLLVDNYMHELKNVEFNYKDDNLKINIRENIITAPQYLIMKIKQLVQSMISPTITLIYRHIKNSCTFTEKDHSKLKNLAESYFCEIDKINIETKKELLLLPKGQAKSTSKFIIKESSQFYSSLSIWRKLAVSNHTIEIHKSYYFKVDVTIISTVVDAIKEKIDPKYGNGYFESDTGKRVLFIDWSPCILQKDNHQINESIKNFISTSIQQIDRLCTNVVETIGFATTDWENYNNRKQLIENILHEMIKQLSIRDFSNLSWKIVFLFNDEQNDLFNEFSQAILALQTDRDNYEQFFYPISTASIILKTSSNSNISKCKRSINDYMNKHVLTKIKLNYPFYAEIWNKDMINSYYKYCLENFVLPQIIQIDLQNDQQQSLDLIGPICAVNQAVQKYELMSDIERQRILIYTEISESIEQCPINPTSVLNTTTDSSNILLSCCFADNILSRHLTNRLIEEGYQVSLDYSDKTSSSIVSKIKKTDIIVVCFSSNYSENANCTKALHAIKSSEKKYIPIMLTRSSLNQEENWLQVMNTEELYYESFNEEIKFKLNEDLALDYDKLLIELLHYAKPCAVGAIYIISNKNILNNEEQKEKHDQSNIVTTITPEQSQEQEQIYQKRIEQILERDQISPDEIANLMHCLNMILEDCANGKCSTSLNEQELGQSIRKSRRITTENEEKMQLYQNDFEQKQDNDQNKHEESVTKNVSTYFSAFLSIVQHWLEKASNGSVTKGNLPPFSLTGDFNDAIFRTSSKDKTPWWVTSASQYDFNCSSLEFPLVSRLMTSSFCDGDEAHSYFRNLINRDIQFLEYKEKQHQMKSKREQKNQNSIFSSGPHQSHFNTNIKKGTIVWDIIEDQEFLQEYEKRKSGKLIRNPNRLSIGWNRLLDRSVQLVADIKDGKINMASNEVQGKIGKALKTMKEIRKLNVLDDVNNELWRKKRFPLWRQQFIEMKISNTIQWQEFCAAQENQ
ncbi:unnamed protein product [Rotaria socialis]